MTAAKTEAPRMEIDELLALPVSFPLAVAARAHGIRRSTAYNLAKNNNFPCRVLKCGRELRVTRADLYRSLGYPVDMLTKAEARVQPKAPAA